jgi:PAS domain S-box-containing protein
MPSVRTDTPLSAERVILVVDDHAGTRSLLRATLEGAGITVIEASDGKEALRVMRDSAPAVVLQDLALPDIDGFELVGQLRSVHSNRRPSILAFSGLVSSVADERVFAAGFDDVIPKPCDATTLVSIVDGYLPRAHKDEEDAFGEGKHVLVVDDDPTQLRLTSYRLASLGFTIAEAQDGAEALLALSADVPDVIVSDVMMPNLDGFGLAVAIAKDPALRGVPLVLVSSSYVEAKDRALAQRAGARELLLRTPDLQNLVGYLRDLLHESRLGRAAKSERPSLPPSDDFAGEHEERVMRQLERQVLQNASLSRRCSALSTELSILSRMSEAVLTRESVERALEETLAGCFDPAGVSAGALYLLDADEQGISGRSLGALGSFGEEDVQRFFGHAAWLREIMASGKVYTLFSADSVVPAGRDVLLRAGAKSALVIPLVHRGRALGALFMASRADAADMDFLQWRVFAQGVSNQITLSLALSRTFRELAHAQHEAEEQRRLAAEHSAVWRAVVDYAPDIIMNLDLNGLVRFLNRADTDLCVGASWVEHAQAEYRPQRRESLRSVIATGRPATLQSCWLSVGKGPLWIESHLGPILSEGRVTGVAIIERDISQKKQTEAQLIVSDRMASVGTLAAGVAHEINNPLASVMANLDLALHDAQAFSSSVQGSELLDELRDAREAAERVRRIVKDLKIFSRVDEDKLGPVDVEQVLESTLRIAWTEIRHRARLEKEYGHPPAVEANESRLGQVFLNLLVNAAQAIGEGDVRGNEIRLRTGVDAAGRVFVSIADSGSGMPPEVQARLFTPFFTTKPVGVGTGLGLSICHRIVSSVGGQIAVESELGRGTEFRVTLRAARSEPVPEAPPRCRDTPSTRRAHVLVIDDEVLITQVVKRTLGREHDVVGLNSAEDALQLLRSGERFDIILCDLMMPQLTGMDFFAELSAFCPEQAARVVFLSGGAFTARAREFLDEVRNPRLEKPIDTAGLRALIHERVS